MRNFHQIFPMKNKIPYFLIIACMFAATFLYFFRDLLEVFFSQKNLVDVLKNPSTAAVVYASFTSGTLTVLAGFVAMIIYTFQERRESLTATLNWMSTMRDRYHKDEEFQKVRISLVENRNNTLNQLLLEFHEDNENNERAKGIGDEYYPLVMKHKLPDDLKLNWEFLKQFTDYLYFFEEILSYGELLHSFSRGFFQPSETKKLVPTLVDHFGWFLRSLYHCCNPDLKKDGYENAMFFVHYLAENRYRRLTQVGLCVIYANIASVQKERRSKTQKFAKQIIAILNEQRKSEPKMNTLQALERHWGAIIFAAKHTLH